MVFDSASTHSTFRFRLRKAESNSVLTEAAEATRGLLLFSPTKALTSGKVGVEILCRRVSVLVVDWLTSDDVMVVVVVVVFADSWLAEVTSVTSPFSADAFLQSGSLLKFSLLQVRTLCWINLTMSASANSFLHTPQVKVSPPTESGSAERKKRQIFNFFHFPLILRLLASLAPSLKDLIFWFASNWLFTNSLRSIRPSKIEYFVWLLKCCS